MAAPNALFIGPMRAATTWVYEYLKERGDVCLPEGVKETLFFDRRFDKGLQWYEAHFRHFDPGKNLRVVEVAPSYFHTESAPERIKTTIGNPRLLVIVRDPVERSISHYRHLRRRGLVRSSLKEAIHLFPEIVDASRYAKHMERWENAFGKGNIHLLWQDQLRSDPEGFVKMLCDILALPWKPAPEHLLQLEVNAAGDPPSSWLARTGLKIADWFRDYRLYEPIEVAKSLGLKRLFFGSEKSPRRFSVPDEERGLIRDMLLSDWELFNQEYVRNKERP